MGGRLFLDREEGCEGKGGVRGLAKMVECDGHHYTKYMYEDLNLVSTYLIYKQRYEKLWYICVLRIVIQKKEYMYNGISWREHTLNTEIRKNCALYV